MRFADGLEMADNRMTYRIAVKEVAQKHGLYATSNAQALYGENGSGMHTHQSLLQSPLLLPSEAVAQTSGGRYGAVLS
jgi:glutamine synthetase